jgi:hypothetical protein
MHRIQRHRQPHSFILLAPALFAESIDMVLGRIIRSVRGEQHSLIRVHWLKQAFVHSWGCAAFHDPVRGCRLRVRDKSVDVSQR